MGRSFGVCDDQSNRGIYVAPRAWAFGGLGSCWHGVFSNGAWSFDILSHNQRFRFFATLVNYLYCEFAVLVQGVLNGGIEVPSQTRVGAKDPYIMPALIPYNLPPCLTVCNPHFKYGELPF